MLNYYELKENHEILREFVLKYRTELTEESCKLAETLGMADARSYKTFMNELSEDEFVGNYLMNLTLNGSIDAYKRILNGEITFKEYVEELLSI